MAATRAMLLLRALFPGGGYLEVELTTSYTAGHAAARRAAGHHRTDVAATVQGADMKKDFWLERWERKEIGFHQDEVNPYLREFWSQAGLARDRPVFVPLCGKSRDMLWLCEQGHTVLGVELSPIAVEAFFKENGLTPQRSSDGRFDRYEADSICILCGDFFDLNQTDMAQVGAVAQRQAQDFGKQFVNPRRFTFHCQMTSAIRRTAAVADAARE